jgi:anaerobic selenocysteine-containing dehydrogenase
LRTPSGKIELAPAEIVADLARLESQLQDFDSEQFLLVGRRHLRSNNSWMHNIDALVKGDPRCTLQMHPDDATHLGALHGGTVRITSRVGTLEAVVEVTQDIRTRVVSLPHGWGHGLSGTKMRVASTVSGVNTNVLTDEEAMDPLSGNAVLNGIPVKIEAITF